METTLSIITERLNSANITVKSEGMSDYDIKAEINVSGGNVTSITRGGITRKSDKKGLAAFKSTRAGMDPSMDMDMGISTAPQDNPGDNLTITYMVSDVALQCEINQRINEFMTAVKVNPSQYVIYQS